MTQSDIAWAEVTDDRWQPTFERTTVGLTVRFSGLCPRCQHQTTTELARVIPMPASVRGEVEEFTMYCACGHPHKDRPEGDNSCGAYWSYEDEL
ncbi:MAG: hypothetical protein E6F99_30870 [Actinobacteria bacterium]|nr:MAG: hypothetical protein E6F99_30870 [Actinomycetota bacterium]